LSLLEFVLKPLPIDRRSEVRVCDVGVGRIEIRLTFQHLLGKFVENPEALRIDDRPVAHAAEIMELLPEHPGRRLVGLRRRVDYKPFRAGNKAARRLAEHVLRVGALAEQPKLIDEDADRLLARDRLVVRRDDLERGPGRPVRDRPQVRLDVKQRPRVWVRRDHVARRLERVVCHLERWGKDQELAGHAPVADQRREHDRRGVDAFAILL
jgi:hypothetical protein